MHKVFVLCTVGAALMLSACESMPTMGSSMQSNFNGQQYVSGPTSIRDPRFGSPAFYSESDDIRMPQF